MKTFSLRLHDAMVAAVDVVAEEGSIDRSTAIRLLIYDSLNRLGMGGSVSDVRTLTLGDDGQRRVLELVGGPDRGQ